MTAACSAGVRYAIRAEYRERLLAALKCQAPYAVCIKDHIAPVNYKSTLPDREWVAEWVLYVFDDIFAPEEVRRMEGVGYAWKPHSDLHREFWDNKEIRRVRRFFCATCRKHIASLLRPVVLTDYDVARHMDAAFINDGITFQQETA